MIIFNNDYSSLQYNYPMRFYYNINTNSLSLVFYYPDHTAGNIITGTGQEIPLHSWSHMALSVDNGIVRMFIQGKQLNLSANILFNGVASYGNQLEIGNWIAGSEEFNIKGYLTNYRINNTTAVYTKNFTPDFPLTAIPGTTLLLLANSNSPTSSSSQNTVNITNTGDITWDPLSPPQSETEPEPQPEPQPESQPEPQPDPQPEHDHIIPIECICPIPAIPKQGISFGGNLNIPGHEETQVFRTAHQLIHSSSNNAGKTEFSNAEQIRGKRPPPRNTFG
jgi:hypothetical protein